MDHKVLIADLVAILKPVSFCPTCRGILKACETGNLTAVALAVNAAQRSRLIPSHTLLMAVNGWIDSVNRAGVV